MKTNPGQKKKRGYGMIELMVTLSVMSVVMIGMYQVFNEGMQLFRTNTRAADAQTAAIKVLGVITAELVNATPEVAQEYSFGGTELSGIVFATSLTDSGTARFDELSGEIYWQRYISYYYEPDPSGNFDGRVMRAETPVPAENLAGPGDRNRTNAVSNHIAGNSTSVFAADVTAKKRQLSDGISGFDVTLYDGSEGRAEGDTTAANSVIYDITVEAGNPASLKIRNGYYIKVKSRVSPRG